MAAAAAAGLSSPRRFDVLRERSESLQYKFPTRDNRIAAVVSAAPPSVRDAVMDEVEQDAASTRPVVPSALVPLLSTFLKIKTDPSATSVEKDV